MKNDKVVKVSSWWEQRRNSPKFFKNIFIYTTLIFFLACSVFILIFRYINRETEKGDLEIPNLSSAPTPTSAPTPMPTPMPTPTPTPTPMPAPESAAGPLSLENEIALQNDRLTNLEAIIKQQQLILKSAQQLIAFEILHKILEDGFPLKTLTSYLQNNAEPWATEMLYALSPIQESKTYEQLQKLLVLPPSPQIQSRPLWQRIKNVVNSFISIQKLDQEGLSTRGRFSAIHPALQEHNIEKALNMYRKLPPAEQALLSSWEQEAQNRLVLETLKQQMLLELSRN